MRAPTGLVATVAVLAVLSSTVGCEEVRVRPENLELDAPGQDDAPAVEPEAPTLATLGLAEAQKPVHLAAGYYNTCATLTDGRVVCFGDNRSAFGPRMPDEALIEVPRVDDALGVSIGRRRGFAWTRAGRGYSWPGGYGPVVSRIDAPQVSGAATGEGHSCFIFDEARHVRCDGSNEWGQNNSISGGWRIRRVDGVEQVAGLAAGATHSCALHEDGGVTCWGDNRRNQMGDGSDRVRALPSRVPGIEGATQIASHALAVQTCVVDGEGAIRCWGSHGVARAGGTSRLGEHHEVLPELESVAQIGVGPFEVCAVTEAGSVSCYRQSIASAQHEEGAPVYGSPEPIAGIDDAVSVALGAIHACAIRASGDIVCWGANTNGQLGDGSRDDSERPVLATVLAGLTDRGNEAADEAEEADEE